jgi:hypothetical protein
LQPLGQAVEGPEFAILLARILARILDELGQDGEGKAVGQHQFGFQHRMVIDRLAVVGHRQAMRAVSLRKGESAGAINGDHEIPTEQAEAIQHLLANQGPDQSGDNRLHLVGDQSPKGDVEGIAVGTGICAE